MLRRQRSRRDLPLPARPAAARGRDRPGGCGRATWLVAEGRTRFRATARRAPPPAPGAGRAVARFTAATARASNSAKVSAQAGRVLAGDPSWSQSPIGKPSCSRKRVSCRSSSKATGRPLASAAISRCHPGADQRRGDDGGDAADPRQVWPAAAPGRGPPNSAQSSTSPASGPRRSSRSRHGGETRRGSGSASPPWRPCPYAGLRP